MSQDRAAAQNEKNARTTRPNNLPKAYASGGPQTTKKSNVKGIRHSSHNLVNPYPPIVTAGAIEFVKRSPVRRGPGFIRVIATGPIMQWAVNLKGEGGGHDQKQNAYQ